MNKLKGPGDAIASIKSGMTIGIGGWGPRRKPMALVRELLRSDVTDLTVVAYGGADVGMLCAAGKVKKLIFAFVSLDFIPLEPWFRQARQSAAIEVMEIDEGLMLLGLRAAAMRVPFIPTATGLGTDVLKTNPDLKTISSPYADGKEWLAMPALNLDAALIHVDRADARGVCQIKGPDHYMDDLFFTKTQKSRATFTGSAVVLMRWLIFLLVRTQVLVRRYMASMSAILKPMRLALNKKMGGVTISKNTLR